MVMVAGLSALDDSPLQRLLIKSSALIINNIAAMER